MTDCFTEFLEAQLDVMREETGFEKHSDPELRNQKVLEWIELHAAEFRAEWNNKHTGSTL